jgi:HAD superfamily hydrolase (TIGR01459 family)
VINSSILQLSEVITPYTGVLLDAYGVFWGGNRFGLLPGAQDAMKRLVDAGKIVGILSNSTQLADREITKLKAHGVIEGMHYHFLITSGTATRHFFSNLTLPFDTPNKQYWVLGEHDPITSPHFALFEGSPYTATNNIEEADFIYVVTPQLNGLDQTEPDLFQNQVQSIAHHTLPMVCANPDLFAHEGDPPRAVVRQGSIAKMYEALGGNVFYIGKPYPFVYTEALQCFEHRKICNPNQILMIGDTPETDIRGANNVGIDSALILETGIMADRIQKNTHLILNDLPPTDIPNFFIKRLA